MDDLDEILSQPSAVVPLVSAEEAIERIAAIQQEAAVLVAGFAANRIRMTDPAERADLVRLRSRLEDAIAPLALAKGTIERVFLMYAVDAHAKEIPVPGGPAVRYEAPRGEYIVRARELRAALLKLSLLQGSPTRDEVDEALREEEAPVRANNTKLNALAKRYGGEVAEEIALHRTFVVPPPERGRVRFPEVRP